jgi:hypothetical protein
MMRDMRRTLVEIRENTERIRAEREERQMAERDEPGKIGGVWPSEALRSEQDATLATTAPDILPTDAAERKGIPLVSGVLDYFPAALAEIAKVSQAGNDKHNPGEPLHWARGKSMDQADCVGRHLLERGGIDPETGQLHSAQMAWRALALLQLELEANGAPTARGAST